MSDKVAIGAWAAMNARLSPEAAGLMQTAQRWEKEETPAGTVFYPTPPPRTEDDSNYGAVKAAEEAKRFCFDALDKISKAKSALLSRDPRFGYHAVALKTVLNMRHPTAVVDGRKVTYNPAFVHSLTADELVALITHEVGHTVSMHPVRIGARNLKGWNYACDYELNAKIVEARMSLPPGALYDPRFNGMSAEQIYTVLLQEAQENQDGEPTGEQDGQGQGKGKGSNSKPDKKSQNPGKSDDDGDSNEGSSSDGQDNSSEEEENDSNSDSSESDDEEEKDSENKGKDSDNSQEEDNDAGNDDNESNEGDDEDNEDDEDNNEDEDNDEDDEDNDEGDPDDRDGDSDAEPDAWDAYDFEPYGEMEPLQGESGQPTQEEINQWKSDMQISMADSEIAGQFTPAESLNCGKGLGDLFVELAKTPKQATFDWRSELRAFLSASAAASNSRCNYNRPKKKWVRHGYYMPHTVMESLGTVCIGLDTSGSAVHLIPDFFDLVNELLNEFPATDLWVFPCDYNVNKNDIIHREPFGGEVDRPRVHGGGGTSFDPPFVVAREMGLQPTAFVYLTDLYGRVSAINQPACETLWVAPHDLVAQAERNRHEPWSSIPFGRFLPIPNVAYGRGGY